MDEKNQSKAFIGPEEKPEDWPEKKDIPASEMKERVISEKVVSERVIGSSSGVSRFGRKVKGKISSRLGGVGLGLLLIIASFFVVWYSESFEKSADLVASLPVLSVEEAASSSGVIKVQGAITSTPIKAPLENKDVIYYRHTKEELEMVTVTETDTQVIERDGQDIEQTIERLVEKPTWVNKIDNDQWAEVVLDNKITVVPSGADRKISLSTIYSKEEDKMREKIEALLPETNLLVVGEINNNKIEGGSPFIMTTQSNDSLVASLESSEKTMWWFLKLATLLLFGFGLYSVFGPLLLILDAIPILGNIGKTGLFVVTMLIGLIFTVLSSIIIAFWYIILIVLVVLVAYLIYAKQQSPASAKED
jgi:transmembrane protein TMEM43